MKFSNGVSSLKISFNIIQHFRHSVCSLEGLDRSDYLDFIHEDYEVHEFSDLERENLVKQVMHEIREFIEGQSE